MISIDQLPDDLWADIAHLGRYACPLDIRDDQQNARNELYQALCKGPVEDVRDALSHVAITWSTDIEGKKIPPHRNWVNRTASRLALDLDDWMDMQHAGAGRKRAA